MKKAWCFIIAAIFILSSCTDIFFPAPLLPGNEFQNSGVAGAAANVPVNVVASHGEKRSITLSWNPVSAASLYYIYRASSPLDSFVRCAETSQNDFTFNVPPGSSLYYRVSSILSNGAESAMSSYVMGTSLAQPVISDITDISESGAAVTWYMENVSDGTYKNNLLYTVYCYSGAVEVAQIMLDASAISDTRAIFSGLNANTVYEYQVEAYLRSNQSAGEKSDKIDAATARRFRPGPPVSLKAARGTAVDKIELSFALPDMVDIALGDNMFDPKPVYFTVSKRLYSESGNNEYQLACAYFGSSAHNALSKMGAKTFNEYIPGAPVSWVDDTVVRGVQYEYLVQSYVDDINKIISSDASQARVTGWALSEGEVLYGKPAYTLTETGEFYERALLPLVFDFDPKGETYTYTVVAAVDPIGDENGNDPDASGFVISSGPLVHEAAAGYAIEMDLSRKSTAAAPGRGIYSVEIEIALPGNAAPIYRFKALGSIQVSEDTQPIIVENFHIQDGYTNRFVLTWDNYSNRKYIIAQSADRINWTEILTVNNTLSDDDTVTVIENYSHTISGQAADRSVYFRIRPARIVSGGDFKLGQWVYAPVVRTLGIPELSLSGGPSYSTVTAVWTEAQKADAYRIKYRYTEDGASAAYRVAAQVKREELSVDATGKNFKYSFIPHGYNDALRAGKEIQITVDALNEGLQAMVGGGEIATSSAEDVRISLVGPALLNLTAGMAASPQEIAVSWNSVPGASGYYVFRRQFNMTNTAEEASESVAYYVSGTTASTVNIIGKNLETDSLNARTDTALVKAAVSFENSRYTVRDMYLTDIEYDSSAYSRHAPAYMNQQNDLAQGWPYRYFVVPVISRNNVPDPLNAIEFAYAKNGTNANTAIASYTVRENGASIQYSGAAALEQEGFAIGFGQNVTASKGTYSASGNYTNDGIRVSWNPPPRLASLAGFSPRYTVYRREAGSSAWVPVTTVDAQVYIDVPQSRGIAYEYAIGISNTSGGTSQPQHSRRFIALCTSRHDERNRPDMLGYMLGMVRMESVSRNELRDSANNFAEEVRWYNAGISSIYNTTEDYNWGIDGYEVFVMNRNVNTLWHTIADIKKIPNQTNQSVRVSNVQGGDTVQSGLLKVLRDYKHYFKVRSYVLNDGEKVYSPDPDWNYEVLFAQAANRNNQDRANFLETDYIKWGARQIDHTEFARIANLHIAWGVQWAAGSARSGWTTRWAWIRWSDQGSNNGSGGRVGIETSSGVGKWWFNIQNFRPDMDTNANRNSFTYSVTFLTIDTGSTDSNKIIYADTNVSSQFPQWYGRDGNYGSDFADITGPSCVAPLYSGQLRYNSFAWAGGNVEVRYPSGSASVNITNAQANSPLPFQQQEPTGFGTDSCRYTTDAWY